MQICYNYLLVFSATEIIGTLLEHNSIIGYSSLFYCFFLSFSLHILFPGSFSRRKSCRQFGVFTKNTPFTRFRITKLPNTIQNACRS